MLAMWPFLAAVTRAVASFGDMPTSAATAYKSRSRSGDQSSWRDSVLAPVTTGELGDQPGELGPAAPLGDLGAKPYAPR